MTPKPCRKKEEREREREAKRRLRALLPFLEGDTWRAATQALKELDEWAAEYWGGDEAVEIVEDEGDADRGKVARASTPTTTAAGGAPKAARTSSPSTTADGGESAPVRGPQKRGHRATPPLHQPQLARPRRLALTVLLGGAAGGLLHLSASWNRSEATRAVPKTVGATKTT